MTDSATHEELQTKLNNYGLYQQFIKERGEDHRSLDLIHNAVEYSYSRSKAILRHMGEYTLHDSEHSFRVLEIMGLLIDPDQFSSSELFLLILSAFFHDLGMAPLEKTVLSWKKNWDEEPILEGDIEEKEYHLFQQFIMTRPAEREQLKKLIERGSNTQADYLKGIMISDYIRETHAERINDILQQDWEGKIIYCDTDLTSELAQVCRSHNENSLSIIGLEKNLLCRKDDFSCLPLIAGVLRLADIMDFDAKRTPDVLYSHLNIKNDKSLAEWKKHRSIQSWKITSDEIIFNAKCEHPAIESAIHKFCDEIDRELSNCGNIFSKSLEPIFKKRGMNIEIPMAVDRSQIATKLGIDGRPLYSYKDTSFSLSKKQVVELLMGTKLYGNPEVALRELVQNSIDACLLRAACEKEWGNAYIPKIIINYEELEDLYYLKIEDNGMGMNQEIVDKYYSNIGSSYYKSADFYDLKAKCNAAFTPTSRFGIGILSCFMVSDSIHVDTRRVVANYNSDDALSISIEGQESIFFIKEGKRDTPGTFTQLKLREDSNPWLNLNGEEFIAKVRRMIPAPPFEVEVNSQNSKESLLSKKRGNSSEITFKPRTWESHHSIKQYEGTFYSEEKGISASYKIALLTSRGFPADQVDQESIPIDIDGVSYDMENFIYLGGGEIKEQRTTFSIDENRDVHEDSSISWLCKSESIISYQGVEIPMRLFPDYWGRRNQSLYLSWPFPILLALDLEGSCDLDLNSARTEILPGEKWNKIERVIATNILEFLKQKLGGDEWEDLRELITNSSSSELFKKCLRDLCS